MEQLKQNKLLGLFFALSVVIAATVISFAISRKIAMTKGVTPAAPESRPLAANKCPEAEKCPSSDGKHLLSCDPGEDDGTPADSICNSAKRVERCGGKDYCCPAKNGKWTTNMTKCSATPTATPSATVTISPTVSPTTSPTTSVTPKPGCVDKTWTPATSTICEGTKLTQTSNCKNTREVDGTKKTTWTPSTAEICVGTKFIQANTCSTEREVDGTKVTEECCIDKTWTPDPNTVCSDKVLVQTSNCGNKRELDGTKKCCIDKTWTPNTSNICTEKKVTQKSNCGTTREVSGSKTCLPNINIATKVYTDDPRNKSGEYYTDKLTSKVSREEIFVYTIEIKNIGSGTAKNIKLTDTLTGQNQDVLTFLDAENICNYDYPTKRLTCEIEILAPRESANVKFRVQVGTKAVNGKVIKNNARVAYSGKTKEAAVDTLLSSIVACNETCVNDLECSSGLACDVFSDKCRKPTCSKETSCVCKEAVTATPTASVTVIPTEDPTPSVDAIDFPEDGQIAETTPSETLTPIVDNSYLPETGILDFSGKAVLGGSIIVVVLGLLLAL